MPWKNGGGETVEIAVHPSGAALDGFDWRVSTARVSADGPFSGFPGVDRTLVVLTGAGLELTVGGDAPVRLAADSVPFAFPADAPCAARLVGGPVTDLNVMTRRGRFDHAVRRLDVTGPMALDAGDGTVLVVVGRRGSMSAAGEVLGPGDCIVSDADLEMFPRDGSATVLAISLRRRG